MRIAIIGLGLIGGSWGLALREWAKTEEGKTANLELVGFDAKGKQRSLAEKMGVCHRYAATPMDAVKGAQIVIVATPVMAVPETFEDIAEHLEPGTIVTDTCSTKRQVMQWAKTLLPRTVSFVGGHPMAGKTASLEEADANLFKNCTYCLMPTVDVSEDSVDTIVRLVEIVKAKPYFLDPAEHDSYVAAISHLPYLAATSLVNLSGDSEGWREMSKLASTGFQDTTRLAGGNINVYLDICRTNSDAILSWLERYMAQLNEVRNLLKQGGIFNEYGQPRESDANQAAALEDYLSRARTTRDRWQASRAAPPVDERDPGIEMPTRRDMGGGYSRMLFGGLFNKRKRPEDENNPPKR